MSEPTAPRTRGRARRRPTRAAIASRWPRPALWAGAALLAGAVALAAVWLLAESRQASALLQPDAPALVERGQALYAEHCASCHGANLEGQADWRQRKADGRLPAPPHDETGHTWHHPDQVLVALTRDGPAAFAESGYRSDMPGFAELLSEEEIVAVLSYIKSRWPEHIRRRHDGINEQAARQ